MARTTDGRPVLLRYDDVDAALRHPGLATFSVQSLLDHNGIASGPLREWCDLLMLSLEGDDHGRLRGLVNNAQGVSPKVPLLDKTDDMLARALGIGLWAALPRLRRRPLRHRDDARRRRRRPPAPAAALT